MRSRQLFLATTRTGGGGEEEREDELGPEEQNPTAVWETDSVDEEAKENTSFKARPGRAD